MYRSDDPPDDNFPEVQVISQRTLTAHKSHTCTWCRQPIAIGSRYTRVAYLDIENKFHCDRVHNIDGYCVHDTAED
jgi:hypothetical protein